MGIFDFFNKTKQVADAYSDLTQGSSSPESVDKQENRSSSYDDKLKNASARWIQEGQEFKKAINKWLDTIYVDRKNPTEDCPEETRKDMAAYVISELIEFNKQGKHQEFRELFPPDNDPLLDEINSSGRWYNINKVCMLSDGSIIVKIGHSYEWEGVYMIQDDKFILIGSLIAFGFSHNRKYFAKVYDNKIDLHQEWDGPVICSLNLPEGMSMKSLGFVSIDVFSTGKSVVLTTKKGIFYIDEDQCQFIHGKLSEDEESEENEKEQAIVEAAANDENEPQRPATVPAEARWNAAEGEWESGKTNAQGNPVGEWKWWLAPKGYLCCATIYEGEDGEVMSYTRYHEDGTPSRIGRYIGGQPFGETIWLRSDNPTIEQYPPAAGKNVFKTVSIVKGGYTIEEHYYDKQGNEIQEAYISNTEISELIKQLGIMDRYYLDKNWKHLYEAADRLIESGDAEEDDKDQMNVVYYKAYAQYQLSGEQQPENLEDLADEIINLYSFSLWDYLKEDNIYRSALRFAYYIKAQIAINKNEYEEAWEELQNAFNESSPIDDEKELVPCYKMKDFLATKITLNEYVDEDKYVTLDYPHASISPDDQYIALGSYWGPHIIMKKENGVWIETAHIEARSSYPHATRFNYLLEEPSVALSSCHFSRSATVGIPVDQLENMEASAFDMDNESIFPIDEQKWIYSILEHPEGFMLGANDGYIWLKIVYNQAEYLHIGSTILSMDFSEDKKHLIVGTSGGQVIVLRWEDIIKEGTQSRRIDPYLITNLPVKDEKRYIFMAGQEPMVW